MLRKNEETNALSENVGEGMKLEVLFITICQRQPWPKISFGSIRISTMPTPRLIYEVRLNNQANQQEYTPF